MTRWLVKSNLYVASCAASLVYVSYISAGLGDEVIRSWPPAASVLLVWSATLFVYNLDRLSPASKEDLGDAIDLRNRTPDGPLKKLMWGMLGLSLPVMAWCAWAMPWHLVLALVPAALIATGYALPIMYWRGEWRRLKEIPGIKIGLIAVVWSIATVVIPLWEQGLEPWSSIVLLEAASRVLFIFAITLPFDVRDMARDERVGIITIPTLIGVERTRQLAGVALLTTLALQCVLHGVREPMWLLPVMCTMAITAGLISQLHARQPEHYYALYMEGTMGLYAVCMLVSRMLI